MLSATLKIDQRIIILSGHIGVTELIEDLRTYNITECSIEIQADGDELQRCCEILGRPLPPTRVYSFIGQNAQEIALNWYV